MQQTPSPGTVGVLQWTGDNADEMTAFVGDSLVGDLKPQASFLIVSTHGVFDLVQVGNCVVQDACPSVSLYVCTPEQLMLSHTKVDNPFAEQVSP